MSRRSVLGSIGAASGTAGVLSAIGVENVTAKEGSSVDSASITERPEVQNAVSRVDKYRPSQSSVTFHHDDAAMKRMDVRDREDDFVVTEVPADIGTITHMQFGEFVRALAFIDPTALETEMPVRGTATSDSEGSDRSERMWIEGREKNAITFRTGNAAEHQRVAKQLGTEEFDLFTHPETDALIAVREGAVGSTVHSSSERVDQVTVYEAGTQRGDTISQEFVTVDPDEGTVMNKGGFVSPEQGGDDVTTDGEWCENKLGYCATNGYACLQEIVLCSTCVGACVLGTVAWPSVAACIACFLLFCGTAVLPQIGVCDDTRLPQRSNRRWTVRPSIGSRLSRLVHKPSGRRPLLNFLS